MLRIVPRPWIEELDGGRAPLGKIGVLRTEYGDLLREMFLEAVCTDLCVANSIEELADDVESVASLHSSDDPEAAAMRESIHSVPEQADIGTEGYCISVRREDNRTLVNCVGGGSAGAFYATRTLRQMLHDGSIRTGLIVDRPAFTERGVNEGYVARSWSHEERMDLIRFMGEHKMNRFFTATRGIKASRDWREPYTDEELRAMSEEIELARRNHIEMVYSIRPKSIVYSDAKDAELLATKCRQVQDLGVRCFHLLADDIKLKLPGEDASRFGSLAEAHVVVVHGLHEALASSGELVRLLFCPTVYCTRAYHERHHPENREYLDYLGAHLRPEIDIMWTGLQVFSERILSRDADYIAGVLRRKPYIWDNYPVYDGQPVILELGPLRERDPDLHEHVAGWSSNTNRHVASLKMVLATIADYAWNCEAYDPEESHKCAVMRAECPEASHIFTELVREYTSNPINRGIYRADQAGNVRNIYEYVQRQYDPRFRDNVERLREKFSRLLPELDDKMSNRPLFEELRLSMEGFLHLAEAYELNFEMLQTEAASDTDRISEIKAALEGKREQYEQEWEQREELVAALCFLRGEPGYYRKLMRLDRYH